MNRLFIIACNWAYCSLWCGDVRILEGHQTINLMRYNLEMCYNMTSTGATIN